METTPQVFTREEKIRFQHIDQAGIVFYPRFLEMLNGLVEDWFEQALGLSFAAMHGTHGIPTVDLQVQFRSPARLGETLGKSLWVNHLGKSSMRCGFRFEQQADGSLCLEGEVMLVFVRIAEDRAEIQSDPFPDSLREKILRYVVITA
jgi:4-hydroxybenzoyl-CoA thioesterase